ncbi:acetyl-CoA carboxylase biotin carboxylase subunit [Flammeovirga kamogawensis]|uniref:Acetyl-CoA carboxylase biotin carboxylase subunit n=1 Tax=Flammeovirga kamogawensis TaxID=373891 RepID=A0ABX8GUC6_9BACT|nr:acetyl-CoA carboxylase biotin carboxylase subunit [Flammeovirga kamogawensis]MBB6459923.1 acetyl-CoA carboxylase biotin carboxylase subunit [Flammeovirga kamogawensis]QWG07024.1 acetyl-CoA carboxylase biotin carboxylase subunit [Flammeovirga kamogawensis]TRX68845.1 acetyl-CoA carboxylase biotin carboxylase subunit [Flammeovirga kamogawensis]
MRKITRLLIANRGEIAVRILRSAKELGIFTIAVYSEVDEEAPHVALADHAVCIGPASSTHSYLDIDNLLKVCRKLQVDAIHPGYGFLSENSTFAKRVEEEGMIFIGPSAKAIEIMGSKLEAKATVSKFNVPLVPGGDEAITDLVAAKQMADEIGYPILIKASAGGGGKGMRVVDDPNDFENQMERAVSEATSSFGDGAVFIEKYIQNPRHIELQVLADKHGNVVHLFERECSIQRRHQKVIEEAPSSVLTDGLRQEMGDCAVRVAKACDYVGAGTVEFILDEDNSYYFLEMNTRLQVEHTVTEEITQLDLVKEQIRIAEGEELGYDQSSLKINGHAIEVRVYSENPYQNFLPDTGVLNRYEEPAGMGVRVDSGYKQGMEVSMHYDPMMSKLIVWGKTREEAISRMIRSIDEYKITGLETTLPFCKFVLKHDAFVSGNFGTNFVDKFFKPELLIEPLTEEEELVSAAVIAKLFFEKKKSEETSDLTNILTPWKLRRLT